MKSVVTPLLNTSSYKIGEFDNKIKYSLVHSNEINYSKVVVTVGCGIANDKKYYEGIAHLLEHMVFIGSKKYPDVNYFSNLIIKYNGKHNAYTTTCHTQYYYTIDTQGLEESLDVFSRFFIDPLLSKETVESEIKVIHNEFLFRNSSIELYILFLIEMVIKKDSNLGGFGVGNIETLNKKDIADVLKQFHTDFYTTDNISISIQTNLKLNTVFNLIEKYFGTIEYSKSKKIKLDKPFVSNKYVLYEHDNKNLYEIYMILDIPLKYVDLFLLLEHSIIHYLNIYIIDNNYGKSINVYIDKEIGEIRFVIIMNSNGYDNIEKIYGAIQYFFNIFKSDKLNTLYYNYLNISKANFDYITYVNVEELSVSHLYTNNHDKLLKYTYDIRNIFEIKEALNIFTKYLNLDNFSILLAVPVNTFNSKLSNPLILDHYNIKYYVLDKFDMNYSTNINYFNYTIKKNMYISKPIINNEIIDIVRLPTLLYTNIWASDIIHVNDPFVYLWLEISNDNFVSNILNYIVYNYFVSVIIDRILFAELKDLLDFNTSFSTSIALSKISLNFKTNNNQQNIKLILEKSIELFTQMPKYIHKYITNSFVQNLISLVKNNINNIKYKSITSYNEYLIKTNNNIYELSEINDNIDSIDLNIISNITKDILNNSCLKKLIMGNISLNDCKEIYRPYKSYFSKNDCVYKNRKKNKFKNLDLDIVSINPSNEINLIEYYYELSENNNRDSIINDIIEKSLNSIFFDEMRNKQQLGYVTQVKLKNYNDSLYLCQIILTNKDVEFVQNKIKIFNENIFKYLDDNILNHLIENIKSDVLTYEKDLHSLYTSAIRLISSENYGFYKYLNNHKILSNITIKSVKKKIKTSIVYSKSIKRIIRKSTK